MIKRRAEAQEAEQDQIDSSSKQKKDIEDHAKIKQKTKQEKDHDDAIKG